MFLSILCRQVLNCYIRHKWKNREWGKLCWRILSQHTKPLWEP